MPIDNKLPLIGVEEFSELCGRNREKPMLKGLLCEDTNRGRYAARNNYLLRCDRKVFLFSAGRIATRLLRRTSRGCRAGLSLKKCTRRCIRASNVLNYTEA